MVSLNKITYPFYVVEKDAFKILRGTWFEVQGDKWYPLEETEALSIEKKHCDPEWRTMVCIKRGDGCYGCIWR